MSFGKQVAANLKRKATKSGRDFMYMAMWGEEPPKKVHMISRPKKF